MTNAPAAPLLPPRLTVPAPRIPANVVPTELDVPPASTVRWIFPMVRDQRDGGTIPAVSL